VVLVEKMNLHEKEFETIAHALKSCLAKP